MSRGSSFVTYEQFGRATHQISASAHRIDVTCLAWQRRLGAAALFVAASYGLLVLDHLRQSSLGAGTVFMLIMSLALIALWWLGAMTFWFRFRIDVGRDKIMFLARALDPRGRMIVRPLQDFVGFTTVDTSLGPRLHFEFASTPGWLAPRLWLSRAKLVELEAWISTATTEMASAGAPVFDARDDDGPAAAAVATTDKGPALAPWPPPPRAVPLWHRVKLLLGGRVLGSSFLLMIFAPAAASDLFATDVTSPWLFAGPTVETTAVIEACQDTDFRAGMHDDWVRQFRYRFDAGGATWRSSSYSEDDCLGSGTVVPVDHPVGLPSMSRLRGMDRHPLPEAAFPILVAIVLYALGELAAAILAAARKVRFLREGRISLAVFETQTPGHTWAWLLVFRVLVAGRRMTSAYFTNSAQFERQQLVFYDPRRPASREFTGFMGAENLSAFGGIEPKSIGGALFVGIMLTVALWLLFRAIRWSLLNQV